MATIAGHSFHSRRALVVFLGLAGCAADAATHKTAAAAARSTPSHLLATWEPSVRWTPRALEVDVTWDGVPDAVVLGTTEGAAVVGLIEGPVGPGSRHWTMAFPTGPDLQNGICGSPAEALLTAEDASLPLDEFGCQGANQPLVCDHLRDVKARLERAAGKGAKGIRLANGDCDSFHIFFDGSEFRYWRH